MTATIKAKPKAPLRVKVIDALILIASLILAASVFLTVQEPMFNLGAMWVAENIEGAVHQAYNMSALYNVWMFIGGGIMLSFMIGSIEYYPKRFGEAKTRRWLIVTCVILAILIGLNMLVARLTTL